LNIGLVQIADQPSLSRRSRHFFLALSGIVARAVDEMEDGKESVAPLGGEAVLLEEFEGGPEQLTIPTEPVVFVGLWHNVVEGRIDLDAKVRLTSKTVWDFVRKAHERQLPVPPGAIDWLRASRPMDILKSYDDRHFVMLQVTRP
jgi:hypothetical protein